MTMIADSRPRLSRPRILWAHSWRMLLGFFLGLILMGMTYEPYLEGTVPLPAGLSDEHIFVDLLCGLLVLVLYPFRHRFPLSVVAVIVVLSTFSVFSAGIMALAVVSLATRRKPLEIVAISVLSVLSAFVSERVLPVEEPAAWWQVMILAPIAIGTLVVTGLYIGGRRQLLQSLQDQAQSAEREEQARVEAARAGERTRIAREMHDVLAHRLSLVALHAGALEYRSDLSPDATRQAAGIIRENAHLALGELRDVLGMLRDPNTLFEDELSRPQPTLGELSRLLEQSRTVGTEVLVEMGPGVEANVAVLPEATSRHLYRVVQEILTNARRHAPGEPVNLVLSGKPGKEIRVRATNMLVRGDAREAIAASMPSSGLGLVGLQERVRLAGGDLVIDPSITDEFSVEAWLPWSK